MRVYLGNGYKYEINEMIMNLILSGRYYWVSNEIMYTAADLFTETAHPGQQIIVRQTIATGQPGHQTTNIGFCWSDSHSPM